MQVSKGRENAKRNIVLFVIGALLSIISTIVVELADVTSVGWLNYFFVGSFIGAILQIIAIILLRNVNKSYASALWALILNLIVSLVSAVLSTVAIYQEDPSTLERVSNGFDIASNILEALVVINFVKGTNALAEENGKGMPILAKTIIRAYLCIFVLTIVFNVLSFVPAIGNNETVIRIFNIVLLVLFVIRGFAYLFFLIKALWRVK